MAVTQLSQKDYLKKYLSSNTDDKNKKKKKKAPKSVHERFRVVDDDIDLKNMRPLDEGELDLYHLAEDAPQIAGIIDERPDDMRTLEEFRGSRRWKIMSDEHGIEDIRVTAVEYEDKKMVTSSRNHGKSDLAQERGLDSTRESSKTSNKHHDSDSSPASKREGDSDASPPRKSRIHSDSDVSPPRKLQAQRDLGELPLRKDSSETDSDSSPPGKYKHSPTSLKRSNSEVSPHRKEKRKRHLSPVRKSKLDRNISPVRRNNRDGDLSPVRKSKHGTDISPVRKSKHDAELSLTRKYNHESEKPVSTMRKTKYGGSPSRKNKYNSDLSPPRKSRMQNDSDTSPPRKSRRSEEYDETPPRNSRKLDNKINRDQRRCSDSDASPPRRTPRHGLHSVQSRKDSSRASSSLKTSRNNDSDHPGKSHKYEWNGSLPIKTKQGDKIHKDHSLIMESVLPTRRHDRSESPHRKDRHRSSPDSPPRKSRVHAHSRNSCSDNSPQRVSKRPRNAASPSTKRSDYEGRGRVEDKYVHQDRSDKMKGKMEKTLDGKRAGLQVAGELRQEISDLKRRENELFAQMGHEVSGRGAAVVIRDHVTGKRRNLKDEVKKKEEEDEKLAQYREKYSRWGKGLKQAEEQEEKVQQALHEMSKPLARYADDKDLEQHLRNQEREGDPMLEYIRSKKTTETTKSKPKYQGSFLPNRFCIPPGHRWDGVDRSNDYEKQWFERQSSHQAVEEEAYKWSTSDM